MQFCTPYEDWRLFESLGVNLIELTGNHLRDYDWPPLLETFELFEREGIPYYGRAVRSKRPPSHTFSGITATTSYFSAATAPDRNMFS